MPDIPRTIHITKKGSAFASFLVKVSRLLNQLRNPQINPEAIVQCQSQLLVILHDFFAQQLKARYPTLLADLVSQLENAQSSQKRQAWLSEVINLCECWREFLLGDFAVILLNDLANIQFIARDYDSDPLNNFQRRVSHFFSPEKNTEGAIVKLFCKELGRADFSMSAESTNFCDWLKEKLTPTEEINLKLTAN